MKNTVYLSGLLIALGMSGQATEVFTTTGSAGEVVYTDQYSQGARRILVRTAPPPINNETQTATKPAFEEMSPCDQARHIVRKYDNAEVLAEKDEDGNIRILDAEEARAMREQARADEQRLCKEQSDE